MKLRRRGLRRRSGSIFAVVASMALALPANAAGTYADFLVALAQRESAGNYTQVNQYGYAGLYQMGEAALVDAGYYQPDGTARNDWSGSWTGKDGINSLADFLNSPSKQTQAITVYHQQLASAIRSMGLHKYAGRTLGGVLVTESGMIAGAHLVGVGGLRQFLDSGGGTVPKDGNGTTVTTYLSMFGGFSIAGVFPAGGSSSFGGSLQNVPSTSLPVPSSVIAVPPATAFSKATGYTPADVKLVIGMILTTFLFLWVVWTSISHFNSWRKGEMEFVQFQSDLVRAVVVLMVMIVIVQ